MGSQTISAPQAIVDAVGGPTNIRSLTHCATRLRFELGDASIVDTKTLEKIPGVLGVMPQSGDRLQVICGGGVTNVYSGIMDLPGMSNLGAQSNAQVKASARAKVRGKHAWVDNFFEYLSDSFRPILGVLLGASLIIAITAVLDALHIVDFRAADKPAAWVFVDAMWRSVFYFLPLMVAYNAAKKLKVDPWIGGAVMAALMTPEFMKLNNTEVFKNTVCTKNPVLGTDQCVANVFGIPLQLNDYGGQVFPPLIMAAILALLYHGLKKIIPSDVQIVFVPFLSLLIMIPITAFLIGPLGVWLGNGLGVALSWMNTHAPFVFAILIPLLYPFLVPLGLHWPLNALMLINIQTLGYDFIQGPMGCWNFACFGATAGVLFISLREKDVAMRQTATGALAAGLFGGISEPSLYGIHLRFKRVYPRMLLGCFAGGLVIAILSLPFKGVQTSAFVFTSLITIPVFRPMWVYGIAIAVAFLVAMFAIVFTDYRTPEEREAFRAQRNSAQDTSAPEKPEDAAANTPKDSGETGDSTKELEVDAPVSGRVIALDACGDPAFASKALGEGVAIEPSDSAIVAPVSGTLMTVAKTGHAFGIKTDTGVEVLIHVGIDTVKLNGNGFTVKVEAKQRVQAGDKLADVDFGVVQAAGYAKTTLMTITNTASMKAVKPLTGGEVKAGDKVIEVSI